MSIRQLPDDVADKIKSYSTITSLHEVVNGLVKNSLDAGASKISVAVDYSRGNCTVEDDGEGISAEEFGANGGLAKLHNTSRFPFSQDCHGRRGDFLASLSALSLLIITSKQARSFSSTTLSIHHGTRLPQDGRARAIAGFETFDQGTRVAVFDLFGSMPVRVKHRATLFSNSSDLEKELKKLSYNLMALLLAWPTPVSLCVRETKAGRELRLRFTDGRDLAQKTSRLMTQVGLADLSESPFWIPISASAGRLSVDGCISTIPVATRKAQAISLGIHPLENSIGGNVLFDEVNEVFTSSSFGIVEGAELRSRPNGAADAENTKIRKGPEKWPMFYLKFDSRDGTDMDAEGILDHRSASLSSITSLLRAVCYAFLKRHQMRPRKLRSAQRPFSSEAGTGGPPTTGKSAGISSLSIGNGLSSPFDDMHRVKVGSKTGMHLPERARPPLVGPEGVLLRKPFFEDNNIDDEIRGCSSQQMKNGGDDWLNGILRSWNNPVFEITEPGLRHLRLESGTCGNRADPTGGNMETRISKLALKKCDVIAQVDNKFVLIKIPLDLAPVRASHADHRASHALFIVDQHAADERCKLEELMAHYFEDCGAQRKAIVETLERAIKFEVSIQESQLLRDYTEQFAKWGIVYDCVDPTPEETSATVSVTGLPPSILERCRTEPQLLQDILRSEVWKLEESTHKQHNSSVPSSNFHGCPSGILELLHSRACRSAIMFNDELTLAECTSLIRRLAHCLLPFQCAHGRPSVAPLVELGPSTANLLHSIPRAKIHDSRAETVMGSVREWETWFSR